MGYGHAHVVVYRKGGKASSQKQATLFSGMYAFCKTYVSSGKWKTHSYFTAGGRNWKDYKVRIVDTDGKPFKD